MSNLTLDLDPRSRTFEVGRLGPGEHTDERYVFHLLSFLTASGISRATAIKMEKLGYREIEVTCVNFSAELLEFIRQGDSRMRV